jgi:hypothetical protein
VLSGLPELSFLDLLMPENSISCWFYILRRGHTGAVFDDTHIFKQQRIIRLFFRLLLKDRHHSIKHIADYNLYGRKINKDVHKFLAMSVIGPQKQSAGC